MFMACCQLNKAQIQAQQKTWSMVSAQQAHAPACCGTLSMPVPLPPDRSGAEGGEAITTDR